MRLALGARIGPLAAVVGVRVLAARGCHADFNRLPEPMPRLASGAPLHSKTTRGSTYVVSTFRWTMIGRGAGLQACRGCSVDLQGRREPGHRFPQTEARRGKTRRRQH